MNYFDANLNCILENKSVLDVGCADGRNYALNSGIYVGIDSNNRINSYPKSDTRFLMKYDFSNGFIPFLDNSFDVVLLIDVIEHLEKDNANILLKEAERIAREKVILYTPEGFLEQTEEESIKRDITVDKYDVHRCGFEKKELGEMGYMVGVYPGDALHNRQYNALLGVKWLEKK